MELDIKNLDQDTLLAFASLAVILLCFKVLYANTFRLTLKRIALENRFMEPAQAWLLLVPIFNLYWNFEVAKRMADSLTNEFFDRKIAEEESPGRTVGLTFAVINVLTVFPFSPSLLITINLIYIFYFIYYWIKMNRFRELLKDHDLYLIEQKKKEE